MDGPELEMAAEKNLSLATTKAANRGNADTIAHLASDMDDMLEASAVKIQSFYRGQRERKVEELRKVEEEESHSLLSFTERAKNAVRKYKEGMTVANPKKVLAICTRDVVFETYLKESQGVKEMRDALGMWFGTVGKLEWEKTEVNEESESIVVVWQSSEGVQIVDYLELDEKGFISGIDRNVSSNEDILGHHAHVAMDDAGRRLKAIIQSSFRVRHTAGVKSPLGSPAGLTFESPAHASLVSVPTGFPAPVLDSTKLLPQADERRCSADVVKIDMLTEEIEFWRGREKEHEEEAKRLQDLILQSEIAANEAVNKKDQHIRVVRTKFENEQIRFRMAISDLRFQIEDLQTEIETLRGGDATPPHVPTCPEKVEKVYSVMQIKNDVTRREGVAAALDDKRKNAGKWWKKKRLMKAAEEQQRRESLMCPRCKEEEEKEKAAKEKGDVTTPPQYATVEVQTDTLSEEPACILPAAAAAAKKRSLGRKSQDASVLDATTPSEETPMTPPPPSLPSAPMKVNMSVETETLLTWAELDRLIEAACKPETPVPTPVPLADCATSPLPQPSSFEAATSPPPVVLEARQTSMRSQPTSPFDIPWDPAVLEPKPDPTARLPPPTKDVADAAVQTDTSSSHSPVDPRFGRSAGVKYNGTPPPESPIPAYTRVPKEADSCIALAKVSLEHDNAVWQPSPFQDTTMPASHEATYCAKHSPYGPPTKSGRSAQSSLTTRRILPPITEKYKRDFWDVHREWKKLRPSGVGHGIVRVVDVQDIPVLTQRKTRHGGGIRLETELRAFLEDPTQETITFAEFTAFYLYMMESTMERASAGGTKRRGRF